MKISIIVPFYRGNEYLTRLLNSIEAVERVVRNLAEFEVIIVNDSPDIEIFLPDTILNIKILINKSNLGIQETRINGLKHSSGDWIIFLDQDDELVSEGFAEQIDLAKNGDVVVGNGRYILGNVNKKIYQTSSSMRYLIQEEHFIRIRNLIPSPGECLIKREKIPKRWIEHNLIHNGADDWYLWILLFKSGAKFVCNDKQVYIHNDDRGTNLSSNLNKMRESSLEMLRILEKIEILNRIEVKRLSHAIEFKYYQDTKKLSLSKLVKYWDSLVANMRYRLLLNICQKYHW